MWEWGLRNRLDFFEGISPIITLLLFALQTGKVKRKLTSFKIAAHTHMDIYIGTQQQVLPDG